MTTDNRPEKCPTILYGVNLAETPFSPLGLMRMDTAPVPEKRDALVEKHGFLSSLDFYPRCRNARPACNLLLQTHKHAY